VKFAAAVFLAFSSLAFSQVSVVPNATGPASSQIPLSPDLLNRISALIAEHGSDGALKPQVSNALGLTGDGPSWRIREVGARADESNPSGPLQTIGVHLGTAGDVVILDWAHGIGQCIRVQQNGRVVKAIVLDPAADKPLVMPLAEAQKQANADFDFWDRNAERTGYWWTCRGNIKGAHPVDRDKKIEACTWLIQSGKETPREVAVAYLERGWGYRREDAQKQVEDFSQSVKLDPANETAWAQLCQAQNWISEDAKLAAQSCSKAIELNPHSAEPWTFRGDIHLKAKEYELAIADYDHAIKLVPDWMWPLDNRGEAYLRENQIDRAIQDFDSVIRMNPDYAMGFLDRGVAEMRKGDMDAAMADFQMGIKVDPQCGSCFFGQGLVKRAKGKSAEGDADIAKAKELNPKAERNFVEDGIAVQ